ncbi:MAG: hypothetical protein QXJ06_01585 [Candidatus Aenigmatarchaeota archaeon]
MIAKYILIIFLLIPIVYGSTIGIFPLNESFIIKPFKTYNFAFYLFNPSVQDVKVSLYFQCKDKNSLYNYTEIYPKEIIVEANTTILNPKMVLVKIKNPLFIEKNHRNIKYFEPILLGKDLRCRFFAKTEEKTSLIITSELNGKIVGINPIKISAFLFVLMFIFFLFKMI